VSGRLRRARVGLVGAILGVVVGAAMLWLVGLVWFRPWVAHDDFAIFRIALERELDGHVRLVGAHSRLGVFHPGPLREWVFAMPYWLSGRRTAALPATALALNAGWVVWTLVVLSRLRPRRWGVAGALGLVAVVVALGADVGSPWNPHLAVVPAYLACWSVVTVVARDGQGWIACICSASFAAQLHASMLIVGGSVLAAALITIAWRRRRADTALAFGLALLLWSGPIVDLRKGGDANLVRLGTVGADGDAVGLGDAAGHVSRLLWPATPWDRIAVRPSIVEFTGFHRWWLLLVVAVLALMAVSTMAVVHRPGRKDRCEVPAGESAADRLPLVASVTALFAVALTVVSVSFFVEPAYRYLYGALQALAVFALAVVVGGLVTVVEASIGRPAAPSERVTVLGAPVTIAVVVVGVVAAIAVVFASVPRQDGPSGARRELGVEGAVTAALERRPSWRSVEAVPLDLRGAGDLDAEVLDVVVRRGLDARSRRVELGLDAPDDVDGVFAVAMSPTRECLLSEPDAEEIIHGRSDAGDTFSVIAVDRDSVAYDRCIGPPVG
jgi:hypothetical protein